MKFFSIPALLASLVLGIVAAIPTLPLSGNQSAPFRFVYETICTEKGIAQVYYDLGGGLAEANSSRAPFFPSTEPVTVSLALPSGSLQHLRFDPSDRSIPLKIFAPRIEGRNGNLIRRFSAADFRIAHQIASLTPMADGFTIDFTPGAFDAQLDVVLTAPLILEVSAGQKFATWVYHSLAFAAASWALLFLVFRFVQNRGRLQRLREIVAAHPKWTLLAVATGAVALANFPIAFGGKSLVAPNYSGGTYLLYEDFPTLPKAKDNTVILDHGSDVGAIPWQHIPMGMIEGEAYRSGEFPWWNRYNSCGLPLVGQGQSMVGDPVQFLVSLSGSSSLAWDAKYLGTRVLFCFGLGLCVLIITGELVPSALVAASAAFIGFFTYRLNHPANFSVCHAPWVLFCWLAYLKARTPRTRVLALAGLAVSNFALLNSGTVKEAYMLVLTLNAAGILLTLVTLDTWRKRLGALLGAGVAGAVFVSASAPLWLVFLDTLRKAYTSYNIPQAYQIQPSLALGFFDELFFRPLTRGNFVFNPSLNFFLMLGFLYFVASLRTILGDRFARGLALSTLFPASMVFGLIPPSWIAKTPFLANVAHIDNSFSCGLLILVSVIAGLGYSHAAKRLSQPEGRHDALTTLLLFGFLVVLWITFRQAMHKGIFPGDTPFGAIHTGQEVQVPGFVWVSLALQSLACVAIFWILRRSLREQRLTPACAFLLLVSAGSLHWRFAQQPDFVGFNQFTLHSASRVDFTAKSPAVEAIQNGQKDAPFRAIGLNGNFFPGWSAAYRIESINGPDALVNPFYRELINASPFKYIWDWRILVRPEQVAGARPFLDFLNVRYYADLKSDQGLLGRSLSPVRMADLDVYESTSVWPRAFFTDQVYEMKDLGEFTQQVMAAGGKPFAGVYPSALDAEPAAKTLPTNLEARNVVAARDYVLSNSATEFTVETTGPGLVVLTEVWQERSMRVWIDGVRAKPFRANHAFRATYIPTAGKHRVRFEYHPRGHTQHLYLALGGLSLGLVASVLYLRKRDA